MKKTLFLLIAAIILTSCATPTPTPAPTNTPVPPTPVPPTATVTPSPTPLPLLFRDEFDGVLDSGWQWYKEDKANWSLTNNPGWVEIMSGSGNVGDGTMDNNLLRPAPEGNFELETKLKFTPTENFQIAGLIIMESPANFIQFGRAFCNGGPCVNDGFYVDLISGGKFTGENYATPAPAVDTVYLRLRREGNIFTAYTSENGTEWKIIGSHNADFKPVTIGVIAGQAFNSVPKPAQFDYFAIYTLP